MQIFELLVGQYYSA